MSYNCRMQRQIIKKRKTKHKKGCGGREMRRNAGDEWEIP